MLRDDGRTPFFKLALAMMCSPFPLTEYSACVFAQTEERRDLFYSDEAVRRELWQSLSERHGIRRQFSCFDVLRRFVSVEFAVDGQHSRQYG
jgi:hypothetical protein